MGRADGTIRVVVARSAARGQVDLHNVELPGGATVADAVRAAGLESALPMGEAQRSLGIWGRIATLDAPLRDGDRVELYRPLTVDPKEARRLRYKRHRDKTRAR